MMWLALIAVYAILFGSGVYLVVTDHGGWAWIPLLAGCFVEMKSKKGGDPDATAKLLGALADIAAREDTPVPIRFVAREAISEFGKRDGGERG